MAGKNQDNAEVVLAVRIEKTLSDNLNRYLDLLEQRTGIKSNRASMARHALRLFIKKELEMFDTAGR